MDGAAVVAAADALIADAVGDIPEGDYRKPDRVARESLGARIVAGAAHIARTTYAWLRLVAEFDEREGYGCYLGIASTAQFLTWAAGMGSVAAREHVRVARALEKMPQISAAFAAGELSSSKVRECSRVIDLVDEDELLYLARGATAAQVERAVRAFRRGQADRLIHEADRHLTYSTLPGGSVAIRAELPADDAALVLAALQRAILHDKYTHAVAAAEDAGEDPPELPEVDESTIECAGVLPDTPPYSFADALLDVARGYLAHEPEDSSGADRDVVVIHVDATDLPPGPDEQPSQAPLADERGVAPALTASGGDESSRSDGVHPAEDEERWTAWTQHPGSLPSVESSNEAGPSGEIRESAVPAGTPSTSPALPRTMSFWLSGPSIDGIGGIDVPTAHRLLCTARVRVAMHAPSGETLYLGRDQRLANRAQRRALAARDRCCQFPGCVRTRNLDAHHIIWWSRGGPTDIDHLILLCRFHHTLTTAPACRSLIGPVDGSSPGSAASRSRPSSSRPDGGRSFHPAPPPITRRSISSSSAPSPAICCARSMGSTTPTTCGRPIRFRCGAANAARSGRSPASCSTARTSRTRSATPIATPPTLGRPPKRLRRPASLFAREKPARSAPRSDHDEQPRDRVRRVGD